MITVMPFIILFVALVRGIYVLATASAKKKDDRAKKQRENKKTESPRKGTRPAATKTAPRHSDATQSKPARPLGFNPRTECGNK